MTQQGDIPPDLWARIDQMIDRKVAALARSGMLRNASISGGTGLTVGGGGNLTVDGGSFDAKYPAGEGGGVAVHIGDQYESGSYIGTGLLVQAPNGTDMIVARQDTFFGNTRVDLYDSGNRVIVGNDAATGQGLARPYVPFVVYQSRSADWPTVSSGTFTTVYRAKGPKQQPKLYVETWANAVDPASVAEVRVLVNGAPWDVPKLSTAGFVTGLNFGPTAVDGGHMDTLSIEVQFRLASGTGVVQCGAARVEGRQS